MNEKLIKIQQELKVPKNQRNNFGNYNYRSCEDIIEHVKPLCHAAGLSLVLADEMVEVGGRVYVKATALVSDGKQQFTAVGFAREAETKKGMDEAQITGSASSYARKYALNGLFAIDDTKDADATNTHSKSDVIDDLDQAFAHVGKAKDVTDLNVRYKQLSATLQADSEVIAKCAEVKNKLS